MSSKVGVISGVVLGTAAVAAGVCFGVPQIRNNILNIGKNEPVEEQTSTESKSELEIEIEKLTAEITAKNNKIVQYENEIVAKNARIDELTASETQLKSEIESYKELVGSDANYIEIINDLQTQLTAVTTERDSLKAQVNQLVENNKVLTENVSQLQSELVETKELLSKYVATENVDHLQIESYDGTWYLNGTYEDYFIIENGSVFRGNDAVQGVIQVQNNEMKMWLNDGTFETIKLTNNGTSIEINGAVYNNYIVNKTTELNVRYSCFVGEFSYSSEKLIINNDHTISYFDGFNTFYGSYIAKCVEKNVAGNIILIHTLTATLNNEDGSQFVKTYEIENYGPVRDVDTNNVFSFIKSEVSEDLIFTPYNGSPTNCYAFVIAFDKPLIYKNTSNHTMSFNFGGTNSCPFSYMSSTNSGNFSLSSGVKVSCYQKGDISTFNAIRLYFRPMNYAHYTLPEITEIQFDNQIVKFNVLNIEKIGSPEFSFVDWGAYSRFMAVEDFLTKTCDAIPNFVAGSYSADGINFKINEDGTTTSDIDFVGSVNFSEDYTINEDFGEVALTAENTFICNLGKMGLPGTTEGTENYVHGVYVKKSDFLSLSSFDLAFGKEFKNSIYVYNNGTPTLLSSDTYIISETDFENIEYFYFNCLSSDMLLNTNYEDYNVSSLYFIDVNAQLNQGMSVCADYVNIPDSTNSVVSSFAATAETDGFNIYHNVSVVITETTTTADGTAVSIDKTLAFKLKNNTEIVGTAEYNGEILTLTKS